LYSITLQARPFVIQEFIERESPSFTQAARGGLCGIFYCAPLEGIEERMDAGKFFFDQRDKIPAFGRQPAGFSHPFQFEKRNRQFDRSQKNAGARHGMGLLQNLFHVAGLNRFFKPLQSLIVLFQING